MAYFSFLGLTKVGSNANLKTKKKNEKILGILAILVIGIGFLIPKSGAPKNSNSDQLLLTNGDARQLVQSTCHRLQNLLISRNTVAFYQKGGVGVSYMGDAFIIRPNQHFLG